jgi:hypothetical protein
LYGTIVFCCAAVYALAAAATAAADDGVRQFDFGLFQRCAVTAGGAVQCLGESNVFGQVDPKGQDQAFPRPVTVIARGATEVATGAFVSCAVVEGALRCWGDIGGDGKGPRTLIGSGVGAAVVGDDRVCAMVGDAAQCVGVGAQSGSPEYAQLHPVPYTEIEHGVSAISAGQRHACAVAAGAVLCWGEIPLDASGRDERVTRTATPLRVIEHGASAVASGAQHDCAIVDGALWCWGDNTHGQLGIGLDAAHAQPAFRGKPLEDGAQRCSGAGARVEYCWVAHPQRVIERGVTRVFAKGDMTCAVVGAALDCWGDNALGQLGVAAIGDVTAPQRALDGAIGAFALGPQRSCALHDGALECTRRCVQRDGSPCKLAQAGFAAGDLAFGLSDREARLGVWRGTVGGNAVSVCLARAPFDSSYYYVRHRKSISLRTDDDGALREGADDAPSGTWRLGEARGARLEGSWVSPDGARTLPIALDRVHVAGDDATCDSAAAREAYDAPRVARVEIIEGEDFAHTLTAAEAHVASVQVSRDAPHAAEFNAAMRDWVVEQIGEYFACGDSGARVGDADFETKREFEWQHGDWVVLHEWYSNSCGGAHPNAGVTYRTWNLAEGKAVEPWTWIRQGKPNCAAADCGYAPPQGLNDLLHAKAGNDGEDDECAAAIKDNIYYQLRPSAIGLVFTTEFPHVIQACDQDIELSDAEVAPFLSTAGKRALTSLRAKPAAP